MGMSNLSPTQWYGELMVRLRKALVFGGLADRKYEGILTKGDKVIVSEISAVTVNDYTRYSGVTWQDADSVDKTLYIDQEKSTSIWMDAVDLKQAAAGDVVSKYNQETAYALANTIDAHLASKYTEAGSTVTALTVSSSTVLKNLGDIAEKFNEDNVPMGDRWLPVPPWYQNLIVQSTTGLITYTAVPKVFDNGVLTSGWIGEIFGIQLLMSNNVNNNGTAWNLMAVSRDALAFVGQISAVESVKREDYFGEGIKTLYVYGAKTMRPNAMVTCAATKP